MKKPKYKERVCIHCNEVFKPTNSTQKYCFNCKPQAKRNQCPVYFVICNSRACGKLFTTKNATKMFCSVQCKRDKAKEPPHKKCEKCGNDFLGFGRFCSDACRKPPQSIQFMESFGQKPLEGLDFRNALHSPMDGPI